jgi:hypothetical protein
MVELRGEVDATIGIVAEVPDRSVHDLRVADQRLHVVGRIDRRAEQPDHPDRPFDVAGDHVVAHLERPQHDNERA